MYAPPSWGLARQEQARSPTMSHCKGNFMSFFSWKKHARQPEEGSKQERTDIPAAVMLDPLENQSCTNLSANQQPDERIATAPSIHDSSHPNSDHSDHDSIERVIPHSEQETEKSATSSSTPATSTTPERRQLVLSKPATRTQIRTTSYKKHTDTLPTLIDDPFSIYKETRTLKINKHGQKYFKISREETNISTLPLKQQNAAYNHALTNILPANTTRLPDLQTHRAAKKVLQHYRLHLSRLLFTKRAIKDLKLQHRSSTRLWYRCALSSWHPTLFHDPYSKSYIAAIGTFDKILVQEREERGIAALLDRCERFLELQQPGFEAVSWQRGMTGTKRWKEGRRGWVGLGGDYDEDLHVAGQGGEGKDEGRGVGKEALKEALKRAARRAMGRKREVSGVFARGEAEKGK